MKKLFIVALMLLFIAGNIFSQIRLPKIIGSNMVLQREKPVPVWGWDVPGQKVMVEFANQKISATADASGYWKIILSPLKASDKPAEMKIIGSNTISLTNILVGEVWLCSGQSNMEYPMKLNTGYLKPKNGIDSAALDLANAYPTIRLFKVEKVLSTPDVTTTGWNECKGDALEKVSAAGFYFAKNIQKELNVPVGIISSSWGGSRIEPWTPAEGYTALAAFKNESEKTPFIIDSVVPGKDYKSMILPLSPFALKGFLWYQGESNCMQNESVRYADKMQALVESWRTQWNDNKLPFISVAIAPYYYTKRKDHVPHTPETLPEFWEGQWLSLQIPNTWMIVVTDLVDKLSEIHPSYKWEVGRRLSLVAMNKVYGKKNIVSSGPEYKSMKVKNGKVILSFTNADGLKSSDGAPLNWLEVSGNDGKFLPANATIEGKNIIVSNTSISKPVNVRFAWNETAQPNLFSAAGLPAIPFRTNPQKWEYKK